MRIWRSSLNSRLVSVPQVIHQISLICADIQVPRWLNGLLLSSLVLLLVSSLSLDQLRSRLAGFL